MMLLSTVQMVIGTRRITSAEAGHTNLYNYSLSGRPK